MPFFIAFTIAIIDISPCHLTRHFFHYAADIGHYCRHFAAADAIIFIMPLFYFTLFTYADCCSIAFSLPLFIFATFSHVDTIATPDCRRFHYFHCCFDAFAAISLPLLFISRFSYFFHFMPFYVSPFIAFHGFHAIITPPLLIITIIDVIYALFHA